jgi:ubiquinol-cytochrome c reductase cytochrome c subunit
MRTARRALMLALATLCAGAAVWHFARPAPAPAQSQSALRHSGSLVAQGRALFAAGCSSCHGLDARGIPNRGPSLRGVGARAADFYLRTGRMPLNNPDDAPVRAHPAYPERQLRALVAYVGSFGGPGIPRVAPARGSLAAGLQAFTSHCAGCHQVIARGGIVTPAAIAPPLQQATPTQVAEAIRIGPYLMPRFSARQIPPRTVNDIAAYVRWTRHPDDRGGWGIGHIGPVPEGMIAWLLALVALVLVARVIGERAPEDPGGIGRARGIARGDFPTDGRSA